MIASLRPALVLTLLFSLLTGVAYPLAMTGVASVIAPGSAEGSLVRRDGAVIGSSLIGQEFTSNRYFHPRPSATSAPDPRDSTQSIDAPYNAANSSGSNLGPLSRKLLDRVRHDVEELRQRGEASIPADLATASGSGLDPHITPAAARLQVARVALARGLSEAQVLSLVENHAEGRWLGILGEPRVNVLLLNLALDGVK